MQTEHGDVQDVACMVIYRKRWETVLCYYTFASKKKKKKKRKAKARWNEVHKSRCRSLHKDPNKRTSQEFKACYQEILAVIRSHNNETQPASLCFTMSSHLCFHSTLRCFKCFKYSHISDRNTERS